MKQWLFFITPTRVEILSRLTLEEAALIGAHFAYWQKLVQNRQALMVGRMQTTTPDTMGLAVFLAEDQASAQAIGEADPAVAGGVFSMRVHPYQIALLGDPEPFRP